jgi:hypothetical protein
MVPHSLTSSHVLVASPTKPAAQAQRKDPGVSVQVALTWQLCVLEHSLMLAHATPSPEKPRLQAQVNEPAVLAHVAFGDAQLCVPLVHSFISAQAVPGPL